MNLIFERKSIRKFIDKEVEKNKIEKIVHAGQVAPTAGNQDEAEYIIVQDKKNLEKLSEVSPNAKPVKNAGVAIVLICNKNKLKYAENWQQDLGAVAENIWLETGFQGLGGVWIGVAPLQQRMDVVSDILGIPKDYDVFSIFAMGYCDEKIRKDIDVKEYNDQIVHWNKF